MNINKLSYLILIFSVNSILSGVASAATVFVNDFGTTGWRNELLTFSSPFSGTITIGVSNEKDSAVDSTMLVDKISLNGSLIPNGGFEADNINELANYSTVGDVTTATSNTTGAITAHPTEENHMAVLSSSGNANTSGFTNASGEAGTTGSLLKFFLNTESDATLSFDWNFLTSDYAPFNDFGFLFAKFDSAGTANDSYVVLSQIETSAVPVLPSLWLFGSALLGLVVAKKK